MADALIEVEETGFRGGSVTLGPFTRAFSVDKT